MLSRREWVLRLFSAVGVASSAAAIQAGCAIGSSSCDGPPPRQVECFTKAELGEGAGGAGGEGGGSPVDVCPSTEEIRSRLHSAEVESVSDEGDRCCYRYFYYCEGRPLRRDDAAVLAPTIARCDWSEGAPCDALLDEPTSERLAQAWADDAAAEHASIASFSAFVAQLLAIGAPFELVNEAQRALADEVRHARLCYSLASRYAGRKLGPGPLALPPWAAPNLRELALATALEGCVAETVAAYCAAERLKRASDPTVVRALKRIVADEQRHAELAWRFLRWAVEREPALAGELRELFARAQLESERLGGSEVDVSGVARDRCRAHGQLLPDEHAALARRAVHELVAPCSRSLLGGLATVRPAA